MTDYAGDNDSLIINDPLFELHPGMPKPEFMLIGGAKCGSTSFSAYLPTHPQVKECAIKEPNYWSWRRHTRQQYQSFFVNLEPLSFPEPHQCIGGEYSTSSLLHPLVPRRVRGCLPDLRIIILLRNPADRAYSHFIMSQRDGLEPAHSFDEVIRKEIEEVPVLLEAHQGGFQEPGSSSWPPCKLPGDLLISVAEHNERWTERLLINDDDLFRFYYTSYVFRSLYHDQVWRWLQLFLPEKVMFIQSEKFFLEPENIMCSVAKFLGLQPFDFDSDELKNAWGGGASNKFSKPGHYVAMKDETRNLLNDFFSPFNEKLYKLIGENYNWS